MLLLIVNFLNACSRLFRILSYLGILATLNSPIVRPQPQSNALAVLGRNE